MNLEGAKVRDYQFGIEVSAPFLIRETEMCQWVENVQSGFSRKALKRRAPPQMLQMNYSYSTVWS